MSTKCCMCYIVNDYSTDLWMRRCYQAATAAQTDSYLYIYKQHIIYVSVTAVVAVVESRRVRHLPS